MKKTLGVIIGGLLIIAVVLAFFWVSGQNQANQTQEQEDRSRSGDIVRQDGGDEDMGEDQADAFSTTTEDQADETDLDKDESGDDSKGDEQSDKKFEDFFKGYNAAKLSVFADSLIDNIEAVDRKNGLPWYKVSFKEGASIHESFPKTIDDLESSKYPQGCFGVREFAMERLDDWRKAGYGEDGDNPTTRGFYSYDELRTWLRGKLASYPHRDGFIDYYVDKIENEGWELTWTINLCVLDEQIGMLRVKKFAIKASDDAPMYLTMWDGSSGGQVFEKKFDILPYFYGVRAALVPAPNSEEPRVFFELNDFFTSIKLWFYADLSQNRQQFNIKEFCMGYPDYDKVIQDEGSGISMLDDSAFVFGCNPEDANSKY